VVCRFVLVDFGLLCILMCFHHGCDCERLFTVSVSGRCGKKFSRINVNVFVVLESVVL